MPIVPISKSRLRQIIHRLVFTQSTIETQKKPLPNTRKSVAAHLPSFAKIIKYHPVMKTNQIIPKQLIKTKGASRWWRFTKTLGGL